MKNEHLRVVIDTNIIISSLLTEYGQCESFMEMVYAQKYEVIVTETIMDEYERKLRSKKFPFTDETINKILKWFRKNAVFIEINEDLSVPFMDKRDKTDKVFYLAARATHSLLVTGNIKHYPVEEWRTMLWELT